MSPESLKELVAYADRRGITSKQRLFLASP